jgi:hypothetical protein
MVVGEIGRDRKEFLYEMSYCDIMLIIRGYRRRNVLQYQLQRLQVFASTFCMSGNKDGKQPHELWPLYFDKYKEHSEPQLSQEEIEDLQSEISIINKMNEQNEQSQ